MVLSGTSGGLNGPVPVPVGNFVGNFGVVNGPVGNL